MVVEAANRILDAVPQEAPKRLMWFDQAVIKMGAQP